MMQDKIQKVAVFGLGYVGCVTTACLARDGYQIIGVDIRPEKIESIQNGKSPIIEPGLTELISSGVKSGRIQATDDATEAVNQANLVLVCVGTPSKRNGSLELKYVENVCRQIGEVLRAKDTYTVIVVRSTMLPGSAPNILLPLLEETSAKKVGEGFGFGINPEFLREGTAIFDYDNPSYTIIGEFDKRSGDMVQQLYSSIEAPLHRVSLGVAEMVKYANNAFHALKVTFANEIGNLCQAYGLDSHVVMDIFVQDTKLNLSPYYLKPGFSFGGSCLPKDLRALLYTARQADIKLPVLEAILPSNRLQTEKAVEILLQTRKRKVGMIGLSFKDSTDDLRESPAMELAERLIGKGLQLQIYDREVSLSKLHGSNLAYMEQTIPHISSLMQPSLSKTVEWAEVVVVTKKVSHVEVEELVSLLRDDQVLIDLARLNGISVQFSGEYRGISW